MGQHKEESNEKMKQGLFKRFGKKFFKGDTKKANLMGNDGPSGAIVTPTSAPPAQAEPPLIPQSEQIKQNSSQMGLWERAADSLDPGDRKKLDMLVRSKRDGPNVHGPDSLADEVSLTLSRANKLKEDAREATWRPVVDKIIKGALAFKFLGDAAVTFDKSGYAALGWSVVSSGLQLAANAEEAREFVLSSSEVITRFMAKYMQYERIHMGTDAEKDFDRLLTNVYKAVLLYMVALDKYLRQSGPERYAHGIVKPADHPIVLRKKDIDTADAEVSDWLIIILGMRQDTNHSQIQRMLEAMLPEIPEPSQECLKSLAFPEMYDRLNDIEPAAGRTCKWLLRHQKYRDWSDSDCGLLCVKGKPGSGKSTLIRYALGDAVVGSRIQERSLLQQSEGFFGSGETAGAQVKPNVLTLSFFFHDRGTELQKTRLGLFRSLLHQLLRHDPDSIPDALLTTFQDRRKTMGGQGEKWNWHWRELQDFFQLSLRKVLENHQIRLFIDALDEYGEENANELIESFTSWIQACPPQAQFHICFTCRHYPLLDLPRGMAEICLEEENKDDISTYVQEKLSAWSNHESLATIWMDIADRASGVFIWARLIVLDVLRLERKGGNMEMIKLEIKNTPQALDDLYKNLVKKVETDPNSFKLIKWVCFAMQPLTLDELRWAMIVDPEYSNKPDSLQRYEGTDDFATDCDMMEKKLNALSCGLVEAVPSSRVVQFIHQSVKDFFIKKGLLTLHKGQQSSMTKTDINELDLEATTHYQISRTCIRYFSAEEIRQPEDPTHELEDAFPLLRYATTHWIAHVQQSEKKGPQPQTDLLDYFAWPSEAIVQVWVNMCELLGVLPFLERRPPPDTTMLHIASRYRLMGPLLQMVQRQEQLKRGFDPFDDESRTPLWWAAAKGYEDVVRLLLDNGAYVDGRSRPRSTALYEASYNGHLHIVRILLEHEADVNSEGGYYDTALQAALSGGYEQIAQLLLENGADVDLHGGSHRKAPLLYVHIPDEAASSAPA